jgi:hypothetical protein
LVIKKRERRSKSVKRSRCKMTGGKREERTKEVTKTEGRTKKLKGDQCCGSGSISQRYGSGSFYQAKIVIRIRILLSSSKNSKKNLDCYRFVTSL